jgi:hypothetical protein
MKRSGLCSRQRAIRQRRRSDVQWSALLALIRQVKRDALLQGLEKLVQGVAGGKAAPEALERLPSSCLPQYGFGRSTP